MPYKGLALSKCEKCSKLFGRQSLEQVYCSDCLATLEGTGKNDAKTMSAKERSMVGYLTSLMGISPMALEEALTAQNERDEAGEGKLCLKCGQRHVQEGEEYCWHCQVELFQSFRQAASELKEDAAGKNAVDRQKHKVVPPAQASNLTKSVKDKLQRAGKKELRLQNMRISRDDDL